jgi:hypothetical protein
MMRMARIFTALMAAGLLLAGVGAATPSAAAAPRHVARTVRELMTIRTNAPGHPDWPTFTNATWTVAKGDTVIVTIRSYDDGPAPVPAPYTRVSGTVGGVEQVNGHPVRSVSPRAISHTFTIPELGINLPIPAAPKGGSVTVVATIRLTKAGRFPWQCMAPCGTGAGGWGGPMVTAPYMRGVVTVKG